VRALLGALALCNETEGGRHTFLLYFANWYSPVSAGLMLPALSFRHFTQWYSCDRAYHHTPTHQP